MKTNKILILSLIASLNYGAIWAQDYSKEIDTSFFKKCMDSVFNETKVFLSNEFRNNDAVYWFKSDSLFSDTLCDNLLSRLKKIDLQPLKTNTFNLTILDTNVLRYYDSLQLQSILNINYNRLIYKKYFGDTLSHFFNEEQHRKFEEIYETEMMHFEIHNVVVISDIYFSKSNYYMIYRVFLSSRCCINRHRKVGILEINFDKKTFLDCYLVN